MPADLPYGLLVLPALGLAAGVDLYLTLLLLGLAPLVGFWPALPGSLGDLASPGVLLLTGSFYLAELAADRAFSSSLVWNGLHAIIRPVAGTLLALLLLDGEPALLVAGGAVAAAGLASAAHATATGGTLLLRLDGSARVQPLLASVMEDVSVVGMVVLALDRPQVSAWLAGILVTVTLPLAGSQLRAFAFSVRLGVGRVRGVLTGGRWSRPDDFPRWLQAALAAESTVPGGLRGTPAAGLHLPGRPRLVLGWMVVRGETPLFVHGRGPEARVDLGELYPRSLRDEGFLRIAELELPGTRNESPREPPREPILLLTRDGPAPETLRSEFRLD